MFNNLKKKYQLLLSHIYDISCVLWHFIIITFLTQTIVTLVFKCPVTFCPFTKYKIGICCFPDAALSKRSNVLRRCVWYKYRTDIMTLSEIFQFNSVLLVPVGGDNLDFRVFFYISPSRTIIFLNKKKTTCLSDDIMTYILLFFFKNCFIRFV